MFQTGVATPKETTNEPLVPMSAADIQQAAASVVAELSSAGNAASGTVQIDGQSTVGKKLAVESLIPFDDLGRPVYPKNAEGKPVLPINKEGKSVFIDVFLEQLTVMWFYVQPGVPIGL